jgi:hypothetical protein
MEKNANTTVNVYCGHEPVGRFTMKNEVKKHSFGR